MKSFAALIALTVMTGVAHAGIPTQVPEMDAGAGVAALAIAIGAAAIIREKFFRK
ncbi:MAG: hypothetical protein RIE56_11835 [Amphiplicatus sp.]